MAVHNIQGVGEINDHGTHDIASGSQDKDPLAPTQQEKSELQRRRKLFGSVQCSECLL